MIVFSLQRNKLWNGSGFLIKSGALELSSMCFAEQLISLGTGRYTIKMVGSAISGNGIFQLQILSGQTEILSKAAIFHGKANSELLSEFEIFSSGQFKIKLSRGKDSIGRVGVSFFNFFKIIEKKEIQIEKNNNRNVTNDERKTFILLDYDNLTSPSDISSIFLDLKNYKDCFFLLKNSDSSCISFANSNFKLFFELEDMFEYVSIYNSKRIICVEGNIDPDVFQKYNCNIDVLLQSQKQNLYNEISGIMF